MNYRIAGVSFLNAVPLVEWFRVCECAPVQLSLALPSRLPALLSTGQADAALLPVIEIFRGQAAGLLGATGIACRGSVDSVKLFHRGPLSELQRVFVDRGSRTSVALLQVILAETVGLTIPFEIVEPMIGSHLKEHEGILVIGDRCLAFDYRYRQEGEAGNAIALDLGQAWLDLTGLPFVFAAWAAAPGLPKRLGMTGVGEMTDLLTTSREYGLAHIEEIAAREAAAGRLGHGGESTPAALLYYFCRSLRFRLGADELAGMNRFQELCIAHGLVLAGPAPVVL